MAIPFELVWQVMNVRVEPNLDSEEKKMLEKQSDVFAGFNKVQHIYQLVHEWKNMPAEMKLQLADKLDEVTQSHIAKYGEEL